MYFFIIFCEYLTPDTCPCILGTLCIFSTPCEALSFSPIQKSYTDEILRHLLRITKLDKEKFQCIREKTGAQNIVKEIKQYQKKWLQHVQWMDTNRIPNKHYDTDQKDEGT